MSKIMCGSYGVEITPPSFMNKSYKLIWRDHVKYFVEPDDEFNRFRNNAPLSFMLEYLHDRFNGSNYGQKFICMEEGNDGKIHFKFTVHQSRSSLVTDWVSIVKKTIKDYMYPNEVEIENRLALDFYIIGDWTKHGYWSEETGMVYPYMNTQAFKELQEK
jgi:hypothetical protein